MIIATSGSTLINYNRIILSTYSPFNVSEAKTFRDPSTSYTRLLRAFYIIEKNKAVSLIYDTSGFHTDLATIDFLNS
jgi:hypothetical protein